MPDASRRMYPARTRSWWLIASASAGASRNVRSSSRDIRIRARLGAPLRVLCGKRNRMSSKIRTERWGGLAEVLADELHALLHRVGVVALGVEEGKAVGFGLGRRALVGRG